MSLMFLIVKNASSKWKLNFLYNETEIKNLLRNLDTKKASAIDTILSKLVKILVDFLTPLFTKVINTSITQNVFPENTKTASVIPELYQ